MSTKPWWNISSVSKLRGCWSFETDFAKVNERLPTELGWSTKTEVVTLDDILRVKDMIQNATNLFTDDATTSEAPERRDLHTGGNLYSRRLSYSSFYKPSV